MYLKLKVGQRFNYVPIGFDSVSVNENTQMSLLYCPRTILEVRINTRHEKFYNYHILMISTIHPINKCFLFGIANFMTDSFVFDSLKYPNILLHFHLLLNKEDRIEIIKQFRILDEVLLSATVKEVLLLFHLKNINEERTAADC